MSPVDTRQPCAGSPVRALWLVLGERELSWGAVSGSHGQACWQEWGRMALPRPSPVAGGWAQVLEQLPGDAFARAGGIQDLRVWAADQWVGMDVLPWSEELAERDAASAQVCSHLHSAGHPVSSGDWVRTDDRPWGEPRLAVVYPQDLMEGLRRAATRWRVSLRSVLAASVGCWQAWGSQGKAGALAVLHESSLVLLSASHSRWGGASINELRVTPLEGAAPDALRHAWQRHALRASGRMDAGPVPLVDARHASAGALDELPQPLTPASGFEKDLGRFDGQALGQTLVALSVRGSGPSALDAVAQSARSRWVMPLVAMALCAVWWMLAVSVFRNQQALEQAQLSLRQSELSVGAGRRTDTLSREDAARVASVNQAIRQLNLPVHALLHAMQPPRDVMVAVLSVDGVGQSGSASHTSSMRILAEARGSEDMTRYVAYVSGRRPFTGASLSKHEWLQEGGRRSLRFSVEATWSD